MTNKEAAWHLGTYSTTMGSGQTTDEQHNEAKRIAIKALEKEPCDDVVRRQAVLQELTFIGSEIEPDELTCIFRDRIKQLPSVTPQEPKTGRWKKMVSVYDMIEGKYRMIPYTYKDEELGNPPLYVCDCGNTSKKPTHYCPDCGCRME